MSKEEVKIVEKGKEETKLSKEEHLENENKFLKCALEKREKQLEELLNSYNSYIASTELALNTQKTLFQKLLNEIQKG